MQALNRNPVVESEVFIHPEQDEPHYHSYDNKQFFEQKDQRVNHDLSYEGQTEAHKTLNRKEQLLRTKIKASIPQVTEYNNSTGYKRKYSFLKL